MGEGNWSNASYSTISRSKNYDTKSRHEIFEQKQLDKKLDPKLMKDGKRESRDSEDHPHALPIIIALDVTGSMGSIPENLVRNDLPKLMTRIIDGVHKDPAIMFMGIGDGRYDNAPVQVSQFESETELIDNSLTSLYLESGGGGNQNESYSYAWLIAAEHTITDHFEKRGKKGFLFTIGDEKLNPDLIPETLKAHMGYKQAKRIDSKWLYEKAKKQFHIFHIHVINGSYDTDFVEESWKSVMGENFISCESNDVVRVIVDRIASYLNEAVGESPGEETSTQDNAIEPVEPKQNSGPIHR